LAHDQILEVGLQRKSLRRLKAEGNRKMKKLPLQYIYPASRARLIGRHQRTADEAQDQQDEVPTQQILQGAWELAARGRKRRISWAGSNERHRNREYERVSYSHNEESLHLHPLPVTYEQPTSRGGYAEPNPATTALATPPLHHISTQQISYVHYVKL
jgi:hypothetical protein